jgi:hypothetical protein
MFFLNEDTIEAVIDNMSGFIIATVASETGKPLEEVAALFYSSEVYALLSDRRTGYYWDSIPEMIEGFYAETPSLAKARETDAGNAS